MRKNFFFLCLAKVLLSMNRLLEIKSALEKEFINTTKSRNNGKSAKLIAFKKTLFNNNLTEFKKLLISLETFINFDQYNEQVKVYQQLKVKRDKVFDILDKSPVLPNNFKFKIIAQKVIDQTKLKQITMDIKTISDILRPYDGNVEGLDAFVDSLLLAKELVKPEHFGTLLKFTKTRLSGKARTGLSTEITTVEELIADVQQRCKDTTSPESIIAQMKALKMKPNEGAKEYCDSVEKCCTKLKNIYTNQQIPPSVADKMAMKVGIDTLVAGISNPDVKLILKAGTFASFSEALTKVNENCQQETARGAQMLPIFRPRGQMNRPGYANRGNRGGYRQPFNRNGNQNFNNGYHNQGNFNNFRYRNNAFANNAYGNNAFGNPRGRRGNTRHVYNIQTGQQQPDMQPQQMVYPQPIQQQQQISCPQTHFFGQVQRGPPPSSQ